MGLIDYLILAAVLGYGAWCLLGRKKNGGCCGNCESCCGCSQKKSS